MNSIKEHRTSKRYARNLHAQSRSFGWAFALILLAQFAATTALVVALGRLNLLQPWQYNLTLVILYILFALNLILLFRVKAKARQIIAVIPAIIPKLPKLRKNFASIIPPTSLKPCSKLMRERYYALKMARH